MKIIFGIIRYILMSLGTVFALLILLYYVGNLRYIEPSSLQFTDGKSFELETPGEWCGVAPILYKLADSAQPKNELIVKKRGCRIKEITGQGTIYDLIRVQALKASEASAELQLLQACTEKNNQYGITAFQDKGSIYCVSPEKDGLRGVTGFTKFDDDRMAVSAMLIGPGENAEAETKKLISMVHSYKFNK